MGKAAAKNDGFPFQGDNDCDRPACDDMMTKLKRAAQAAAAESSTTKKAPSPSVVECPLGSAELGRASWGLLHSMAAWYPDQPSLDDQRSMVDFFAALARFYPCTWCAQDFRDHLTSAPVQAETRQNLCQWLCRQHNVVNAKLGKPMFPCDMTSLDRRWRKNDDTEDCRTTHDDH